MNSFIIFINSIVKTRLLKSGCKKQFVDRIICILKFSEGEIEVLSK